MVDEKVNISSPLGYVSWILNNSSPSRLNPEENSLQSCLHQLSFPSSLQSSWKCSQSKKLWLWGHFEIQCPFYFISVQSEDRELDIAAALNTAGASADSQHSLPILILNVQPVNIWPCCNSNCQSYYLFRLVLQTFQRLSQSRRRHNTRAFSWLKAPTSVFTFKTLLRHWLA